MRLLLLLVFGALGTLARYGLQGLVQFRTGASFPSGTLSVNLLGCFFLGLFSQYALHRFAVPPDWRIGITIGFFGAFTTFSTFGYETVRMLEDGEWSKAALYVGASAVGGLLAVAAGVRLGDLV